MITLSWNNYLNQNPEKTKRKKHITNHTPKLIRQHTKWYIANRNLLETIISKLNIFTLHKIN